MCINVTPSSLHDGTAYNHRHILDTYGDRRTRAYKYYVNAFSPFPSLGNVFLFSSLLVAIVHFFRHKTALEKENKRNRKGLPSVPRLKTALNRLVPHNHLHFQLIIRSCRKKDTLFLRHNAGERTTSGYKYPSFLIFQFCCSVRVCKERSFYGCRCERAKEHTYASQFLYLKVETPHLIRYLWKVDVDTFFPTLSAALQIFKRLRLFRINCLFVFSQYQRGKKEVMREVQYRVQTNLKSILYLHWYYQMHSTS